MTDIPTDQLDALMAEGYWVGMTAIGHGSKYRTDEEALAGLRTAALDWGEALLLDVEERALDGEEYAVALGIVLAALRAMRGGG